MKTRISFAILASFLFSTHHVQAQGTAFTYQGRLESTNGPAHGLYDFRCQLYDAIEFGALVSTTVTNAAVPVSNGLFVLNLDFGPTVFNGQERWLLITVRTNNDLNFTALFPRQRVAPTPYAIFAKNVGIGGLTAGTYPSAVTFNNAANNFSGSFNGEGGALSNVNAMVLGGITASNFWRLGGNNIASNQFLGTLNGQVLDLMSAGQRVLRIQYDSGSIPVVSPGIIGGHAANTANIGVTRGATIGGGGTLVNPNIISDGATFGTISGGVGNVISNAADFATIGGGQFNHAAANEATVAGGAFNNALGFSSAIGGGGGHTANGSWSVIAGGRDNQILSGADYAAITGGRNNTVEAGGDYATLSGGQSNQAFGAAATIGGGVLNAANGLRSVIGGGANNTANGIYSVIPGGQFNETADNFSFAAGRNAKAVHAGTFVWADNQGVDLTSTAVNQFLVRAATGVGIGTAAPAAQLHVSNNGGDLFPQEQLNQQNAADYARLRLTVAGNYSKRWDMAATTNRFVIYSGHFAAEMIALDSTGLYVRGTFVSGSDRNTKENFVLVEPREVLDKVASLPISKWNYQNDATPHIGPMAQDFHAAFGVGPDDKHIAMVDADGVALAAIQGLNQKVEEQKTSLKEKEEKIALLEHRLNALEKLISSLTAGSGISHR